MNTQTEQFDTWQRPLGVGVHSGMSRSSPVDSDPEIDIRGMLLMLWRRKYVIFSLVIIGICSAMIGLSFIKPSYIARTLVLIEDSSTQQKIPDELKLMVSNYMRFDNSLILNEIEVIKSRTMARRVIERLSLMTDPELNASYQKFIKDNTAESAVKGEGFKTLSLYKDELGSLPANVSDEQINQVITRFLENLQVRAISGSYVIQIQYSAHDPNKAALVANTIADIYIENRLDTKFKATQKLSSWLDNRLKELREQVRVSDQAAAAYAAKHNLFQGSKTIMSAEELSQLNTQLVNAKAAQAEAKASLEQVSQLAKNPESIGSAVEIINSGFIQNLKRDAVALQRKKSDFSERYGERHPEMIKIQTELADLNSKIEQEMVKIADSLQNELAIADARVEALEISLEEAKGARGIDNEKMIKLNELTRDVESNRLIFDNFLQTYKRTDEQEKLQEAQARVLSYAAVPNKPAYPDRLLFLSLTTALSLFLGIFLSFMLEKMDNTFRSASQLEKYIGFPCFALIPRLENMNQKELGKFILDKPSSVVAESVRTLRTVLGLRGRKNGQKPKIITITSSFPGEGKTTLSCWLSRLAAKSGDKVILIDGDLRRPNIHKTLNCKNDMTLVDYLTDKATLEDVIQKTDPSGLHVICAKSVPNSALDLIGSDRMKRLVESLGQVYDMVIIDSPASLAVSDARVFSMLSDHTVYCIAWDRTPREVVMAGVKQFADMGYSSLSLVLTNVDVKRHARYGYGDTLYYYGNYNEEPQKA
jgi:capsular exopolysaccharide synthesis family protein